MYTKKDTNYRNTYQVELIERDIKSDKKNITKSTALLGASALAVGIGALGITFLGKNLMNIFSSGEAITLGTYILVKFQESATTLSTLSVLGGITSAIYNTKNAITSLIKLKEDKNKLNELEEKGKHR